MGKDPIVVPQLSPEVEAIIRKVAAQEQRPMTPEEIKAWAERLAADVAGLTD